LNHGLLLRYYLALSYEEASNKDKLLPNLDILLLGKHPLRTLIPGFSATGQVSKSPPNGPTTPMSHTWLSLKQFHQRFTRNFCANFLLSKNYQLKS